jgi:hypothetical protein
MRYYFVLFSFLGLNASAQDSLAVFYSNTITAEELSTHLHIISSDEYEGRETGYNGQKMCEEYMVKFYQELGLPPVEGSYIQEFEVSLDVPSRVYVNQGDRSYFFLDDFYYSPGTKDGIIEGTVVFADYGINTSNYNSKSEAILKDKVVIIWDGEPKDKAGNYLLTGSDKPSTWSTDRELKMKTIEAKGAKALMVIHDDYESRKSQVSGYFSHNSMSLMTDRTTQKPIMPVFHISPTMAERMLGAKAMKKAAKKRKIGKPYIARGDKAEIKFDRGSEVLTSSNVMGYIEGTDLKDEVIIITAHYDHIGVDGDEVYNGADDDGSGTVATMEIAQAFSLAKKAGHGPRRSVMILNVSAEEKGLLGSRYYTENPILPLENTVADLNIDMIGRVDEAHEGDENYVYLIGADRLSQDLHDVGEYVNQTYTNLDLDYTFNAKNDPNRFYYRSDHYNFAKNNVPAVFYFSGVHEDYHQPGDTVDKIMFPKLAKITQLIFHTAWELANRPERIKLRP